MDGINDPTGRIGPASFRNMPPLLRNTFGVGVILITLLAVGPPLAGALQGDPRVDPRIHAFLEHTASGGVVRDREAVYRYVHEGDQTAVPADERGGARSSINGICTIERVRVRRDGAMIQCARRNTLPAFSVSLALPENRIDWARRVRNDPDPRLAYVGLLRRFGDSDQPGTPHGIEVTPRRVLHCAASGECEGLRVQHEAAPGSAS